MLLTLGLLVAALWVASGWWWLSYYTGESSLSLAKGRASISSGGLPVNAERSLTLLPKKYRGLDWRVLADEPTWNGEIVAFRRDRAQRGTITAVEFMLWPLPLLLCTTGGLAVWSGRRARRRALEGHCPTCGYNLAGLNRDAGGVCPECGTVRSGAERMNAGN